MTRKIALACVLGSFLCARVAAELPETINSTKRWAAWRSEILVYWKAMTPPPDRNDRLAIGPVARRDRSGGGMTRPSKTNSPYVLRVECRDRPGLVHAITGALFRHGMNILQNDEFVDAEGGRFFMRTEFSGKKDPSTIPRELRRALGGGAAIELILPRKKNIVVFASREPHCLGDLLVRHAYGQLNARILAVVANHRALEPLAAKFAIPFYAVSYERRSRKAAESEILKILARYGPEYLVLAKFMRILSDGFVRRFENRIVNIHHSFLPAFAGRHPYEQAARRGVKIIGATAHLVTPKLDDGPIIAQDVVEVDHSHSVADMTQAGHDIEKIVLAKALRLLLEDRIFVSGNRTILFD